MQRLRLFSFLLALVCALSCSAQAHDDDYDKALFEPKVPAPMLEVLKTLAGKTTTEALKDKNLKVVMKITVPDCEYHYGKDMSLHAALDLVLNGSKDPVQLLNDRYIFISGAQAPYLGGRGFLWFDTVDGVGLGGFFFQPTNGEPTPALSVFSRQVKEPVVTIDHFPVTFLQIMSQWAAATHMPPITTRYFLNGLNKRVLLEHDEDYCVRADGSVAAPNDPCQQQVAYAADVDETAAYYLDKIHYATNGTAWMLGPDQTAWLHTRDQSCGGVLDCRIRVTREHTHAILHLPPPHAHGRR